jgi:hypothetical protein
MKKLFKEDFDNAWNRIESNLPFAHARYADGEICLMKGIPIGGGSQATDVDRWSAPTGITKLGKDLRESLSCVDPYYYYAISCDSSNTEDKQWLLNNIKQDREYVTFANLWINGNYNRFIDRLTTLKKDITIIANENGENKKYPFNVSDYMSFGNDCVNVWEENKGQIMQILGESFNNTSGQTFFISVGPLSEAIIYLLWKLNPRNQYIDVGSALDEFVHGRKTRPYMIEGSFYNKQICEMEIN